MKNRNVGILVIGISLVIVLIVLLFSSSMKAIISSSCTGEHALSCPMYDSINHQTFLALSIVGILIIIGLVLIFAKPDEKVVIKKIPEKRREKKINLFNLKTEDKKIFNLIKGYGGTIFQAELIEKSGFSKQKVSRIVDRLEGKNIVERKRRGMTNIVVIKKA